jgi:hypothetical protein
MRCIADDCNTRQTAVILTQSRTPVPAATRLPHGFRRQRRTVKRWIAGDVLQFRDADQERDGIMPVAT